MKNYKQNTCFFFCVLGEDDGDRDGVGGWGDEGYGRDYGKRGKQET